MKIKFDLFPGHKKRAVTFSYDDGTKFDRLLVEKFDKYGAKCTFNLNSDRIGKGDVYLNEDAYRRREVRQRDFRSPRDRVSRVHASVCGTFAA